MDMAAVSQAAPPMAEVARNTKQKTMNTVRSDIMPQNLKKKKNSTGCWLNQDAMSVRVTKRYYFRLTQIKPEILRREKCRL